MKNRKPKNRFEANITGPLWQSLELGAAIKRSITDNEELAKRFIQLERVVSLLIAPSEHLPTDGDGGQRRELGEADFQLLPGEERIPNEL